VTTSDDERFRALVQEHVPTLTAYLRRRLYPLGTSELDDVVEETLIVAWRQLDRIPSAAPAPYLIGIGRNVLRNAQRAARRRTNYEGQVRPSGVMASAEDEVVGDQSVRQALETLRPADREVLTLAAWDGLDVEALASVLHIGVNAAAVRLSRAERRFREALAAFDTAAGNEGSGADRER
jgi:RNA polymerase sigma-70 factor, ECF subfamily